MRADRPDGHRLTADEQRQLDDLERRLLYGPAAPPRPAATGSGAPVRRRPVPRLVWVVAAALSCGLLALAVLVGGLGGAAATAAALLATLLVWRISRMRPSRWRILRV